MPASLPTRPRAPGKVRPETGDHSAFRIPHSGLYLHVPFCVAKCAYCDFYSVPLREVGGSAPAAFSDGRQPAPQSPGRSGELAPRSLRRRGVAAYLEALEREAAAAPADFAPETVFVGGGTPTVLEPADLARVLAVARRALGGRAALEWTVEANPGTLTPEKLRVLREAGVNRLSLGAQSFDDDLLSRLGRRHDAAAIGAAVRLAREAGFRDLGLDLLYAIPGQTLDALERDLRRALALEPGHLSAYALTIEAGTPLAAQVRAGAVRPVDDETALAHFERVRELLSEAGYVHYEISNFARPGRACRHNLLYWSGGEYLGFGPAAHSHWRGVRWGNFQTLEEWTAAVSKGWKPRAFEERLAPEAHARETFVFGLRRIAGWDREAFRQRTGFDYEALRRPEIRDLAARGLLRHTPENVRLADRALFVSDAVFAELI